MKCPAIERAIVMFVLFNVLLFKFTSAQDHAAITRCSEGLGACETKAYLESCGAALQCFKDLTSTCDIIGLTEALALRTTWYEYKCSDQGQADYQAYTSCLIKPGDSGLLHCVTVYADDNGDSCMAYERYRNCVRSNCGEGVARYVHNEVGILVCDTNSGSNGGTGGTPGEDSALYKQCSADQTACEGRTLCGEALECLINVRTRCNIFAFTEALSLRIKWYEYKCSEQGLADRAEYQTCSSKPTGGLSECSTAYFQELQMVTGNQQKICLIQDKYEECVMKNCGDAARRYLQKELGDLVRLACYGSNGGVHLLPHIRFYLIWFSILVYMVHALY